MNRKKLLGALALAGTALAVAGCQSTQNQPTPYLSEQAEVDAQVEQLLAQMKGFDSGVVEAALEYEAIIDDKERVGDIDRREAARLRREHMEFMSDFNRQR